MYTQWNLVDSIFSDVSEFLQTDTRPKCILTCWTESQTLLNILSLRCVCGGWVHGMCVHIWSSEQVVKYLLPSLYCSFSTPLPWISLPLNWKLTEFARQAGCSASRVLEIHLSLSSGAWIIGTGNQAGEIWTLVLSLKLKLCLLF